MIFEIWASQGQSGIKIEEVSSLEIALKYIEDHEGEASFAIKLPNGEWYKWQK